MNSASNAISISHTAGVSFSRAFPTNVAAGSLLIAAVRYATAANVLNSVTDTIGNTWSILGPYGTLDGRTGYLAWCVSISSGANTVTWNHTVSEGGHVAVAEFTLDGTASLDLDDTSPVANNVNPAVTNSRSPTASNGGGISMLITTGNRTITGTNNGETDVTAATGGRLHLIFKAFASAVAQQHSITCDTAATFTYPLVLFADTVGVVQDLRAHIGEPITGSSVLN